MEIKEYLKFSDSENSVLFLGSGFSAMAENIKHENLPVGDALRKKFADIVGVDQNAYNLQTLADEVFNSRTVDLYDTIHETFTINKLTVCQQEILDLPWLRIYTTNYDDSVEYAYIRSGRKIHSFSYDDEKPKKLPSSSIIHLHGSVQRLSRENILDQLVLNESSYIRQHFERSSWYDEFIRDIRFSSNVFFLGYSLSDYHISALLMQENLLKDKTFFIKRGRDGIFENRVRDYGSVLSIGLDAFISQYKNLPKAEKFKDPYKLRAFSYINPLKDKKTLSHPTPGEVLSLVAYGTFNEQRCLSSLPNTTYVVPRTKLVKSALDLLDQAKTLIVHSYIGNGKTIFLSILSYALSRDGYKCFWCREVSPLLKKEVFSIASVENVIILFDSYNVAIEAIDVISNDVPNAKFIVAVRTGTQEVRLHEIMDKLPMPFERINLNALYECEKNDFLNLLDGAGGGVSKDFRQDILRCDSVREIVGAVYKNKDIHNKLEKELRPLLNNRAIGNIIITSHLVKWIGYDANNILLRAVSGKDPYVEVAKSKDIISEFCRLDGESVLSHSSIFSEYLIRNFFKFEDMFDVIYYIIIETVKRKKERYYQAILGKLMQVSKLISLGGDRDLIENLFNRLHRDIDINKEPLFWLQYSILMLDSASLMEAEMYLKTAYSRAKDNPGFRTYQIDTHALRLLLIIEQQESDIDKVGRIDEIMEKINIVSSMVAEDSHRGFAMKVLNEVEPFVRNRIRSLSLSEKNALLIQFDCLISNLQHIPPDIRISFNDGGDPLQSIENSRKLLLLGAAL